MSKTVTPSASGQMASIWADGLGTCSPAKHDSNTDVALAQTPQATKAFSTEIKQVEVKKKTKQKRCLIAYLIVRKTGLKTKGWAPDHAGSTLADQSNRKTVAKLCPRQAGVLWKEQLLHSLLPRPWLGYLHVVHSAVFAVVLPSHAVLCSCCDFCGFCD